MAEPWTVLIAAHAAGATLALLLGGYLVVRRRKGDLLHRRVGRIWMVDMYWVSFSSFGIQRLDPGHFTWIHGLSAWTIISLTMAIWAAATHRIAQHRQWVVGTYLGLVGAGIAAVAFPVRMVPQTAMHYPWLLLGALAGITAVAWLVICLSKVRSESRRVAAAERPYETKPAVRAMATASARDATARTARTMSSAPTSLSR
jgi:uncharacterized membrane protein